MIMRGRDTTALTLTLNIVYKIMLKKAEKISDVFLNKIAICYRFTYDKNGIIISGYVFKRMMMV